MLLSTYQVLSPSGTTYHNEQHNSLGISIIVNTLPQHPSSISVISRTLSPQSPPAASRAALASKLVDKLRFNAKRFPELALAHSVTRLKQLCKEHSTVINSELDKRLAALASAASAEHQHQIDMALEQSCSKAEHFIQACLQSLDDAALAGGFENDKGILYDLYAFCVGMVRDEVVAATMDRLTAALLASMLAASGRISTLARGAAVGITALAYQVATSNNSNDAKEKQHQQTINSFKASLEAYKAQQSQLQQLGIQLVVNMAQMPLAMILDVPNAQCLRLETSKEACDAFVHGQLLQLRADLHEACQELCSRWLWDHCAAQMGIDHAVLLPDVIYSISMLRSTLQERYCSPSCFAVMINKPSEEE